MPVDQRIEAIIEQLTTILILLERPIVQQLVGLGVGWLVRGAPTHQPTHQPTTHQPTIKRDPN